MTDLDSGLCSLSTLASLHIPSVALSQIHTQEESETGLDDIPPTDPCTTDLLWASVHCDTKAGTMPAKQGKAKNLAKPMHSHQRAEDELVDEPLFPPQSSTPTSYTPSLASTVQTRDTTVSRGASKQVGPRDNDFRETVLRPRGIIIEGATYSLAEPFAHFGTQYTTETNYMALPELRDLCVWLKDNDSLFKEISEEYHCMVQNNLCEAEFATYGKEKLFKNESRRFEIPEDRRWRTERMIELMAKPSPRERWEAPPVLDSSATHRGYQFDIRPDCSYWLSLQAFNKDWRDRVEEHVLVMYDRVTCPYFTVEFKRDDSGDTAAENQVATAGALALYNRYLLRATSLRQSSTPWSEQDCSEVRHYGATFGDQNLLCGVLSHHCRRLENGAVAGCTVSSGASVIPSVESDHLLPGRMRSMRGVFELMDRPARGTLSVHFRAQAFELQTLVCRRCEASLAIKYRILKDGCSACRTTSGCVAAINCATRGRPLFATPACLQQLIVQRMIHLLEEGKGVDIR